MHIILASPIPTPSGPPSNLSPTAMPPNKNLPKPAPKIPSRIPAANPGNRICRNPSAKPPANALCGAKKAKNTTPAAKPGQLTASGNSRTRKSVTVSITIRHVRNSHFTVACVMPNSKNAATNNNPVASSISGYLTDIGAPHARHFPRNHIHANTGTLSYGLIAVLHRGQREPGVTLEISSGIRVMQTFRKLPTIIPNRKKKTVMMTTVCTATPQPLFSICHTRPTASINRPSPRARCLTVPAPNAPLAVSCGAKRSIPTVALGTGHEGHARSPNAPCSSAPGACPDRVGASLRHPFFGLEEENHPQTRRRSSLFRTKDCKLKTDNCLYELV